MGDVVSDDNGNEVRVVSLRAVAGGVAADVRKVSGPATVSEWTTNADNLRARS